MKAYLDFNPVITNYNNNNNNNNNTKTYELIHNGTIVKVKLALKHGGHTTPDFPDGYATLSKAGTSVYLACEFLILDGEYTGRKVWSNIGLHSEKSSLYGEIGRKTITSILNSAHGLHSKDMSTEAVKQRRIQSFDDLNDLVCLAEISINDSGEKPKNDIKKIITPDSPIYDEYMRDRSGKFKIQYQNNNNDMSSVEDDLDDEIQWK